MAQRIRRFGHQIKADGDADKSDKERGRAFILDFPALIKHPHAHGQAIPASLHRRRVLV